MVKGFVYRASSQILLLNNPKKANNDYYLNATKHGLELQLTWGKLKWGLIKIQPSKANTASSGQDKISSQITWNQIQTKQYTGTTLPPLASAYLVDPLRQQ